MAECDLTGRSFPVMGTTAHVTVCGVAPNAAAPLLDQAAARLADLERRWSRFLSDSELSQINRSGGAPIVVSSETFDLISSAVDAWVLTNGVFDPTIGATMVAAGYDRPLADIDQSLSVDSTAFRGSPGAQDIALYADSNAVQIPAGTMLDLGGIAKGAAADLIAHELIANLGDAAGSLVNVGGDIAATGTPPRTEGWQIGLDCPGSSKQLTIGLRRGAVCTSTKTARKWGDEHHLRNPQTGQKLETGLASVTVVTARAAQGEVLTKAVFAAGPLEGRSLLAEAETTGVFVLDDGSLVALDGLDRFLAAAIHPEPV